MLLSNDLFLFRTEIQLKSNERNNSPKLSHCESQTGNDENVANIGKIHYLDNSEERLDKR